MEEYRMNRYDIAIIGTGPAGVSAAITAKVRNKNVLLLGSADISDKVAKLSEERTAAVTGEKALSARLEELRGKLRFESGEKAQLRCEAAKIDRAAFR